MLKTYISIFGVALTFAGYIPYVNDILKKKTTPHSFTWFIYTLVGFIGVGLQIKGGAGVGVWTLLCACLFCFLIFILSLKNGAKDITFIDVIFLILALLALFLWLVVNQPVWSVILASGTEILGFGPTVRKSWNKPYSETIFTYEISAARHIISIFSLERLNILTLLYPLAWAVANAVFTFILIARRRQTKRLQ